MEAAPLWTKGVTLVEIFKENEKNLGRISHCVFELEFKFTKSWPMLNWPQYEKQACMFCFCMAS